MAIYIVHEETGKEAICNRDQLSLMEKAGWKVKPAGYSAPAVEADEEPEPAPDEE